MVAETPTTASGPGFVVQITGRADAYLTTRETVCGVHYEWTADVTLAQLFESESEARAAVREHVDELQVALDEVDILPDPMAVNPTLGDA